MELIKVILVYILAFFYSSIFWQYIYLIFYSPRRADEKDKINHAYNIGCFRYCV